MSGSASGGVAVRASSPNQGAFRRQFASALATQETCISGTSFAATNWPRFERPCRPSRRLSHKNHRNPFFPVGSTVFGISAGETTATAPQRCCDSSVTNLRRCRGTQGSGVHPGPPTDGLTSEQAFLRFRSWHHRFPGHTGRSFDRPAPLALPSESPVQHPMELPFSLAGPWLPHRTIRTTSR